MTEAEITQRISAFLASIGIPVHEKPLPDNTFLPGIRIEYGSLAIDPDKLAYPGDMLHEAGHIAAMAPSIRAKAFDNAGDEMGEEIAAHAWSYAAALACGIPAEVVFHSNGYKGAATWLKEHYESDECFAGLPLLAWYGLTAVPGQNTNSDECVFPKMKAWLRAHDDPSQIK
ncbi:hypothetical protein [Kordiimonas sp.]|uniref:hypothetical protein n=1 Tax=Kordiimonas sp. TaxID=1970157 RepID=UPI003A946B9C